MTDEEALLAAIIAEPDDDLPRLVYADWLDEHGRHDRAEFIRVQCRLAREGAAEPGDEERAFELEVSNRGRWLLGLPLFEGVVWTFRRGFPEVLEAPIDVLLEWYDRFAAVPWVRTLSLFDAVNWSVRDLVSRPWNPAWVELELQEHPMSGVVEYGYDSTPGVLAVANSPQARQLRTLKLPLFGLSRAVVEALATSPYLAGLRCLGISGDPKVPGCAPLRERFGDRLVGV